MNDTPTEAINIYTILSFKFLSTFQQLIVILPSFCSMIFNWISSTIHLNQSYVILQSLHFAAGPMESTADREITEMQPVEMEPCETEETNSMPDSDANQEVDFFEKKGKSHGRREKLRTHHIVWDELLTADKLGRCGQDFSIFHTLHGFSNTPLSFIILLIKQIQRYVFHWQTCDKIRWMLWKVLKINLSRHPTLERQWRCWICLTRKSHYFARALICSWLL